MKMKGYAICTAARSGSNWIGQVLSSTGQLGHSLEYFNGYGRRLLDDPDYPDDPARQIDRVLTSGATSNGIYALKVFTGQLDHVATQIKWSRALPELHFVYWRRRDIVAQAISQLRANQTSQWRAHLAPRGQPAYDANQISECLRSIVQQQARWDAYFARNILCPMYLYYEDALRNPQAAVDEVAKMLGLDSRPEVDLSRVDIRVQRDDLTSEWYERYTKDAFDLDYIDKV